MKTRTAKMGLFLVSGLLFGPSKSSKERCKWYSINKPLQIQISRYHIKETIPILEFLKKRFSLDFFKFHAIEASKYGERTENR